jgi:hypothetical protein
MVGERLLGKIPEGEYVATTINCNRQTAEVCYAADVTTTTPE